MFKDLDLYTHLILDAPADVGLVRKAESAIHTLVLLKKADTSESEMALLDKMLTALRLAPAEVEIWKVPDNPAVLWNRVRTSAPGYVLLFGISTTEIGLHLQTGKYEPIHFSGIRLLFSDALAKLGTDGKLKAMLWKALQQMYSL